MCIFSGPVHDVGETSIFCRNKNGRQTIVYSMNVEFENPVAMVLPIPTKSHQEDAVEFINLEKEANFFKDLDTPFEIRSRSIGAKGLNAGPTLKVHEVGSYIASFVPHRLFFERLDEAFRVKDDIWSQLPQYASFGYAVFQLKGGKGNNHYHPMGFTFPTKNETELFFPTVHVHDGVVKEKGDFDHAIYWQGKDIMRLSVKDGENLRKFDSAVQNSPESADKYIKSELVDPNLIIYKTRIIGWKENKDLYAV